GMNVFKVIFGSLHWALLLLSNCVYNSRTNEQNTLAHVLTDPERETLQATHKGFIEVYALYDHSYVSQFNNTYEAENYILQIFKYANAVFQKVEVMIVLLGIEKVDRVTLSGGIDVSIGNLLAYKKTFSIEHDYLMLFTNDQIDGKLRSIYFAEGMCHSEKSAGVVKASIPASVTLVAWIVANQLALSLGMRNDTDKCVCHEQHCIMQEVPRRP
ncbi:unnamed protein product, partial [Meganyctiphanes norvegica]